MRCGGVGKGMMKTHTGRKQAVRNGSSKRLGYSGNVRCLSWDRGRPARIRTIAGATPAVAGGISPLSAVSFRLRHVVHFKQNHAAGAVRAGYVQSVGARRKSDEQ